MNVIIIRVKVGQIQYHFFNNYAPKKKKTAVKVREGRRGQQVRTLTVGGKNRPY